MTAWSAEVRSCAREEAAEQALTKALEERLPQHPAPLALKRRLAAQWPMPSVPRPSWWSLWGRSLVPAFAVAVPLQGGAVGYFLDRKAAVFIFHRRLHAISLFVFRAGDLPWPARGGEPLRNTEAYTTVARGFNVILWQSGELGYALVSDLDRQELTQLVLKLAGGA